MIYLPNKYTKCYYKIIHSAQSRDIQSLYNEKHHIIPECFYKIRKRKGPPGLLDGNSSSADNIVLLTAKEHFVCHLLLTKMVEGKLRSKMHLALLTMSISGKNQSRYRITSETYRKIREAAGIANSGSNNPMWGKIRTQEECDRISEGIARSERASARKFIVTQEHRNKISESKKNKPRPKHVIDAMMAGRKKVSFDNNSGKHWYNNGIKNALSKECPPEYYPGRLPY